MRHWTRKAGFLPAAAALAVALSGCSLEVLNPGAIQDADLNTPDLMPTLARGVSAEFNDIADEYAFFGSQLTDEAAGTGSYSSTQQYRQGIFDYQDSEFYWAQAHEAAWAAKEAWVRFQDVLEGAEQSSPDAAELFVIKGMAYRVLGENFCRMVFNVGPSVDRTLAFDSAIAAFNMAITIGTAAGTDGAHWVTAANAGKAQAYFGKASLTGAAADWTSAVTAAGLVPIDFVDVAHYHENANTNLYWGESWGRAENGVYRTLAQTIYDDVQDPRVAYTRCGEWRTPGAAYPDIIAGGVDPTGNCTGQGSGAHQGADGQHAHYRQDKYTERGSDVPRASGVEMRMIEAEAALLAGTPDFTAFIDAVNEVRNHYGMADRAAPTTLGTLDWPHEYPAVDAMSVLDEERYMTLWIEGRRLFDLDRWDHPFINGGWITGGNGEDPRLSCMPISRDECLQNENLLGDAAACPST